jgi:hypothetical protein
MKKNRLHRIVGALGLALLGLLLAACTNLSVQNTSTDQVAVVSITMPDRNQPQTVVLQPGDSFAETFGGGGPFNVSVVAYGSYTNTLQLMRPKMAEVMGSFAAATKSGEELREIIKEIEQMRKDLFANAASCGGNIPEDGEGIAVISWDAAASKWQASCSTKKAETSDSE